MPSFASSTTYALAPRQLCALLKTSEPLDIALFTAASGSAPQPGQLGRHYSGGASTVNGPTGGGV